MFLRLKKFEFFDFPFFLGPLVLRDAETAILIKYVFWRWGAGRHEGKLFLLFLGKLFDNSKTKKEPQSQKIAKTAK